MIFLGGVILNSELIIKLKSKLDYLIKVNMFENRFVVLFGVNTPGDEVINYLLENNIKVDAIIDNNHINSGKKLLEINVYTPNDLLSEYKDNLLVLICSRYYFEMRAQLEKMGYVSDKHIFKILDMNSDVEYSVKRDLFNKNSKFVLDAMTVYENIKNEYGKDVFIFLNPVKANGDVYITCRYLESYVKKNNIKNYVLVVIGKACYNVAKLFEIGNVEIASQEEMELLVRMERFVGGLKVKIKVMQPYIMYTNFLNNLDGYKGLNFNDFFKHSLFELEDTAKKRTPINLFDKKKLEKFIKEKHFIKGKTVILSPYANSLPQMSWKFWSRLTEKLNESGYKVFTNSSGKNETIIPNSEPIFFDFCDAIDILEYAGFFIGVRSGLCEILSSAKCKKIVLYPDKACRFCKVINVYGLKNMGLSEDVIEIEADDNIEILLEQVLHNL